MIQAEKKLFPFAGLSMFPSLRPGDRLEVEEKGELTPGSVYCFRRDGSVFAHRLMEVTGGTAVFSGDASGIEERVDRREVIGRVVRVYRKGRSLTPSAKRPALRALYPVMAAVVRALLAFRRFFRAGKAP